MFSNARKRITIASFLMSLVVLLPKYIDRHDGAFSPGFWFSAIVFVSMGTLWVYAGLVVIDKAFNGKRMMSDAFLISFVVSSRRLIEKYDGAPTPGFWFAAIIRLAMVTLLVYATFVVINKALNYAGLLFKRIFRNRTPKM